MENEIEIDEKPFIKENFCTFQASNDFLESVTPLAHECFDDDNGNDAHDKNDNYYENEKKFSMENEIEIDEKPLIKENFCTFQESNDSLESVTPMDDNNNGIGSISKAESSSSHDDSSDYNIEERPSLASLREFRSREQDSISVDNSDTMQTYTCGKCKFVGQSRKQLQTHSKIHNGREHICEFCQYATSNRNTLEKHYRIHTGEKPFKCEICDYKCAVKHKLKIHHRKHTGEKPYSCTICDSKFFDSSTLTKHTRIHTGEKPYSCKICSFKFSRSDHITDHMRIHHKDIYREMPREIVRVKRFHCTECSYKTCDSRNFSRHKNSHSGMEHFLCDICGHTYSTSWSLSRHKKTKHVK
ncbi:zinc finger protein 260-like [Nilaparvata lugens]|uniref:zinc finger protein 260-like n=1 Tax=Nilaparvata lugens TaxID=108931 RepID=UPI00193DCBB8|nr:zinc finger protein 260-like [Nilaparvata lugens]